MRIVSLNLVIIILMSTNLVQAEVTTQTQLDEINHSQLTPDSKYGSPLYSEKYLASNGHENSQVERRIVAYTRDVFIRDTSNPKLGKAYQDPSGVIWGSVLSKSMNQYDANNACKKIGARLPTVDEFRRLRVYLGGGSRGHYKPFTADGSEVIPGLSHQMFWTSSKEFNLLELDGKDKGDIGYHNRSRVSAVRCVAKS